MHRRAVRRPPASRCPTRSSVSLLLPRLPVRPRSRDPPRAPTAQPAQRQKEQRQKKQRQKKQRQRGTVDDRPSDPHRRGGSGAPDALRPPRREITDATRRLVQDLIDTVDDDGRAGVAANQIGVTRRAFSWNLEDLGVGCILDPVIVELSDELQEGGEEGCLSVPGLWFPRTRAAFARCVGRDVDGHEIELAGGGDHRALIQHEVGHLDGALYIDGLERSVRKQALRRIRESL